MYLDRNQIKILALLLMIIDHVGIFIFNNATLFRGIGRLSFPLFVFLLADGFQRTHDISKYAKRLILFWLISIIPYSLAFYRVSFALQQNIFLSLYVYLSLYCVLINKYISILNKYIISIIIAIFSEWFHLSYGCYGIALSIIMFQYKKQIKTQNDAMFEIMLLGTIYGIINGSLLPIIAGFSLLFLTPNATIPESQRPDKVTSLCIYALYPMHLLFFALLF